MSIVSRETDETLDDFAQLLLKWNKSINLISKSTISEVRERHINDSLQIIQHIEFQDTWLDMGSGGGLPGIVLAIAAKGRGADTKFTLVESDQRKCAFLRTATLQFDLNISVVSERVENIQHHPVDHISARALAPLSQLLTYAKPFFAPTTIAVFPKGQNHQAELIEAQKHWTFEAELLESNTQASAAIVLIRNLQ